LLVVHGENWSVFAASSVLVGLGSIATPAIVTFLIRKRWRQCVMPLGERPTQNKKGPNRSGARGCISCGAYLSAFWTLVNVALRFVPTFFTTVMIATEIPAAIRPYSIAVAPDSFFRNATKYFIEGLLRPYELVGSPDQPRAVGGAKIDHAKYFLQSAKNEPDNLI